MKVRAYIEMARLAIDSINAKTMTIAEVLEYWSAVVAEEPALNLNRQRTRAELVERLEDIIRFCNEIGRMGNSAETHAEALQMDAEYQLAIATIADNLTLPIWEGCSDTVKTEVVKHHHAEALEMNRRCSELYYRYWRWWNVMDEYCRADDFACAHKTALKMNAEIDGETE